MKDKITVTLKPKEVVYVCKALILLSDNKDESEEQRHIYLNKVEEFMKALNPPVVKNFIP